MFVTVNTIKKHSNGKVREIGDKYSLRRQTAKLLQAFGNVEIIEGSESSSPSVDPKLRKLNVQPATKESVAISETLTDNTVTNVESTETETTGETETVTTPAPVVTEEAPAKKVRKSKYQTRDMKA